MMMISLQPPTGADLAGLPPLPPHLAGRPFGARPDGRVIRDVTGAAALAAIGQMQDSVVQRVERELPAGLDPAERQRRIEEAREAALDELVDRLNSAIPEPAFHISARYLLEEGNYYSEEFIFYLNALAGEISGDPDFYFHRGARSIPSSIGLLARPLSLRQVYGLLPRLVRQVNDADIRVVRVTDSSAVIQWYPERQLQKLPVALHRLYIRQACPTFQGVFAAIPPAHSRLPMAHICETRCAQRGDECCEWEFTWQNPARRGLFRFWPPVERLPANGAPQRRGLLRLWSRLERPASAGAAPAGPDGGAHPRQPEFPSTGRPAVARPAAELPPLPPHLEGRPFGARPDGSVIRDITGVAVWAAIGQMQDSVGQSVERELPAQLDPAERQSRVEEAREAALDELVNRLNAAIRDPAYHITRGYLLDETNYYSHECSLYLNELARDISGDPDFHFRRGLRSIPQSFVHLGRPLPLRQVYNLLPRLASRVTDADLRIVRTTATSAVIQWRPERQLQTLPPTLHQRYIHMACPAYQGVFASIPRLHSALPLADIRENRCLLNGDDYCEWEFTWQMPRPDTGKLVWGGGLGTVALLAALAWRVPGWQWLAGLGVALPVVAAWLVSHIRTLAYEADHQNRLLLEQREQSEAQYDNMQQAHAELQASNVTLQHRLAELTALHEIGLATSATLHLDGLLDQSLQAITTRLGFDRALILLLDEGGRALSVARSSHVTPGIAALTGGWQIPVDDPDGFLARVLRSGKPILVTDPDQVQDEAMQQYVSALATRAFLIVPLITQGKAIGLLAVDNGVSGRAIPENGQGLLFTVGAQIAAAVDAARLYQTMEQRVEQRTAEARESERRLADIISFLPDATLVIDAQGKIIAWNHAIEILTGIPAAEMLGQGDYSYAVPFYGQRRPILIDLVLLPREEFEQKYAHIRREGEILTGETYVPQLRGQPAYLYATASALRDSTSQVVGAIETIRDITDRKRAEEALQEARQAAEAATMAKSAFLATMSHEIRTPMNAVIGMTGLLLDTPLTAEQREFAETIRTSGDALLTIINDILDFSKIEAGRMELECQPFDVRECLEGALDLLASKAAEKGLNLAGVVDPSVPPAIAGDVTRLRQVLVNLVGNAIKFTERGEVVVSVTAKQGNSAEPGGTQGRSGELGGSQGSSGELSSEFPGGPPSSYELHFAVRDTGIGIPPERRDRLFQSFSQVDASTTRRFGGTGLGLAISKRLVELMGGTMWVESEGVPGRGSTFHFIIQAAVAQPVAKRAYLQGLQPRLEGKRVLIVDDNPTNRRILTLQTQAWGMRPRETGSPLEALAWLRQGEPFDVAFLDLQMPELDGLELAAEIRRLRDARVLPVVILSSMGKREASLASGEVIPLLLKPIKASLLYNVLVGLWAEEPAPAPAAAPGAPQFDAEMGQRHPLRLLLAEDNAVNQKLALRILGRLGYRADVAGNGVEVLQSLRRQAYDVVLMDVQMPEMDGLEATRAIRREWPGEGGPRIIAMTANAMKEDREECLAAGMDDYLSKPIRVEELVAALNKSQPLAVRG